MSLNAAIIANVVEGKKFRYVTEIYRASGLSRKEFESAMYELKYSCGIDLLDFIAV